MPEGKAWLVAVLLEHEPVDAGFACTCEIGLVQAEDPVEPAHVEHQLAGARRQGAAYARGATHGRDRNAIGTRPAHDRDDLLATGRPRNQDLRALRAVALLHEPERPQVTHLALVERGGADDFLDLGSHWFGFAANEPASHPVNKGKPNPHYPA